MGAIVIGLAARYGTREAGEPATVLLPFAADFENVTVGEVRPVTPVLILLIFTALHPVRVRGSLPSWIRTARQDTRTATAGLDGRDNVACRATLFARETGKQVELHDVITRLRIEKQKIGSCLTAQEFCAELGIGVECTDALLVGV